MSDSVRYAAAASAGTAAGGGAGVEAGASGQGVEGFGERGGAEAGGGRGGGPPDRARFLGPARLDERLRQPPLAAGGLVDVVRAERAEHRFPRLGGVVTGRPAVLRLGPGEPAAALRAEQRLRVGRIAGALARDVDQLLGPGQLGRLGVGVPGQPGGDRAVSAGGQRDRGRADHRGLVQAPLVRVHRRLGVRQRQVGVAAPQLPFGQQAADEVADEAVRPERFEPGPALLDGRVAPGHVDEQRHPGQHRFGQAGDPDREAVGQPLGLVPLAEQEAGLEVQMAQVHAVGREAEPFRVRPELALLRGPRRLGELAPGLVLLGQQVGRPQFDLEHLRSLGLLERGGVHPAGRIGVALAAAQHAEREQCLRGHPAGLAVGGVARPLRPLPSRRAVPVDHEGQRVGRHRAGLVPRRRVGRGRPDGLGGDPERLGRGVGGLALKQEVRQPLADVTAQHAWIFLAGGDAAVGARPGPARSAAAGAPRGARRRPRTRPRPTGRRACPG